jgi:hypothetical protein
MDNHEIQGTIDNPVIFPLSHSEIHHAAIADHGEFAVYMDSRSIYPGKTDYKSIILNEQSPILDLKEKGIDLDSTYQRFEFTKGGSKKELG